MLPTAEMIDPLVAMRAACLNLADGDAAEIEMEWRSTLEDRIDQPGTETVLTITVRSEVRHFEPPSPPLQMETPDG